MSTVANNHPVAFTRLYADQTGPEYPANPKVAQTVLASMAEHADGPDQPNEALFLSHLVKIRAADAEWEKAKAVLDEKAATRTDLFRLAKTDGFTRKELRAILDDGKSSRRDLQAEEERRATLRAWAGLPVGTQPDMFSGGPEIPEAAKDELAHEADGYQAGMRATERKPPDTVPAGGSTQAWLKGYDAGQERNAWALSQTGKKPAAPTTAH